jgi:hypothetical protein
LAVSLITAEDAPKLESILQACKSPIDELPGLRGRPPVVILFIF